MPKFRTINGRLVEGGPWSGYNFHGGKGGSSGAKKDEKGKSGGGGDSKKSGASGGGSSKSEPWATGAKGARPKGFGEVPPTGAMSVGARVSFAGGSATIKSIDAKAGMLKLSDGKTIPRSKITGYKTDRATKAAIKADSRSPFDDSNPWD